MFSPTVTELPRRLEPISRDTFIDPRGRRPSGPSGPHALAHKVIELRPAGRLRAIARSAA